jgi:hypothetical protein
MCVEASVSLERLAEQLSPEKKNFAKKSCDKITSANEQIETSLQFGR